MSADGEARLEPLRAADFDAVAAVARTIWHAHYDPMIGAAQVDYMLARRLAPEALSAYLDARDRWFDVLRADGAIAGYCSAALTAAPRELKLEQLYLLPALHGRGLGGMMLRHVEARAHALGCGAILLQVAKLNAGSIAIYERAGYRIREAILIDIGEGFMMDDFLMEKRLA